MTDQKVYLLLAAAVNAPADVKEQVENTLMAVPYGLRTVGEAINTVADILAGHTPDVYYTQG